MVTLFKSNKESAALITNKLGVNILTVPHHYVFRKITDNQFEIIIDDIHTGVVLSKKLKAEMIKTRSIMFGVLN
jgi:hypothetical protein